MRRFDELEAAALDERDIVPGQLDFQVERVKARAEQDSDIVERYALLAQLEDALADEARLILLVFGRNQYRVDVADLAGEQVLGMALAGAGDDGVCEIQDRLRAAIVFLQGDDPGTREQRA